MKSVPFDLQAEQSTLGACLLDRKAIIAIAGWLTPDHFYLEKYALLYEAMLACFNRREPPDYTTVIGELRRQERLDLVGGMPTLMELTESAISAVHVEYYGRLVEQAAGRRRLIEAGGKIAALGFDETEELGLTFDRAEQILFEVTQRSSLSGGLLTARPAWERHGRDGRGVRVELPRVGHLRRAPRGPAGQGPPRPRRRAAELDHRG